MVKTKIYDNGLKLVVEEMANYESCAFHLFVKTGSINEKAGNYGISHLIEHMLFKGTQKRTAFDITKDLDKIGANVNAYTDRAETCYYTKSTGDHVNECVEILSDMFFNSVFDEKELASEIKVVCEEIAMYEDDPTAVCEINANKIFYNGTEYQRDVGSTAENVKNITRAKILDYVNEFYTSKNVTISFAGNITFENAQKLVDEYFANKFNNVAQKVERKIVEPIVKEHFITAFKDNQQSILCISNPALKADDNRVYALRTLNLAWGVGMSSRLFQTIREKLGLVYSINSSLYLNDAGGDLTIVLGTTNKNVPLALSKIKEEIELLSKEGLTQEEFDRAKSCYISNIKLSYENTSVVSLSNAKNFAHFEKTMSKEDVLNKIKSVTLNEVNTLAKEIYSSDKCVVSYVGSDENIDLSKYFKI